jgi:Spy/CpxP family protein refolding chaperone
MKGRGRTKLAIWLALVGVFALGCVTGVSLAGVYRSRAGVEAAPEARPKEDLFEQLRRELKLNDEQAAQVRSVIEETREKYRALRSECRPRYDAARAAGRERIRAVLTPEQRRAFDSIAAARDAERDRREQESR